MSEKTQTSTEYRLKDTDPTVSISTALAQPGEVIEFDYDGYASLVHSLGGPEDNSQLQIKLQAEDPTDPKTGGRYSPDKRQITTLRSDIHLQNSGLVHETAHYVDFENRPATRADRRALRQMRAARQRTEKLATGTNFIGAEYLHRHYRRLAERRYAQNSREQFAVGAQNNLQPRIVTRTSKTEA